MALFKQNAPHSEPIWNACVNRFLFYFHFFVVHCLFLSQMALFHFIHTNLTTVCEVILLIMWLYCGAKTPGGEVFVRSFVSHYPEGFSTLFFFFLKQVPRLYHCYRFIAFPSLPAKRHHWHWLRCGKNLLMCLNYLCLMLGASVCSSALGPHYSCDGNALRITALHPIWLHSCEKCHRAWRPL